MFITKLNSKQKRAKTTQERETENVVSVQFARRNILRHGELNLQTLRHGDQGPRRGELKLMALGNLTFFIQKSHF